MSPVELAAGVIESWTGVRPIVLPLAGMFPVRADQPRVYLAELGDVVAVGFVSFFIQPKTWDYDSPTGLTTPLGRIRGQYQPGGWPVLRMDRAPIPAGYEPLHEHFLLNDQVLEFWRIWAP